MKIKRYVDGDFVDFEEVADPLPDLGTMKSKSTEKSIAAQTASLDVTEEPSADASVQPV